MVVQIKADPLLSNCLVAVSGVGEGYSKHPDGAKNRRLSSIPPAEL